MARPNRKVYFFCGGLVLLIIVLTVVIVATVRFCPSGTFPHGAVAADTLTCSEIGRDILRRNGSAVDAAIAALLCTSLLNPQSAGIGGGSIFTVMDSSGHVRIINSRERTPSNVDRNLLMFQHEYGIKWTGIPGEIRGYQIAHQLHKKGLNWADLFQPAIDLARKGFPIPKVLAGYISKIKREEPLWEVFSDENGNLLKEGDIIKFEKLANTLEIIANNGADTFYTGKIAQDLVRDVKEAGGVLTLQDLASYNAIVTDAWVVPLGEYQMYIPPPPSGGPLLGFILNVMKGYNMSSAPQSIDEKIQFYYRYIETLKFANGLKKQIRDPNFASGTNPEKLINEEYAQCIRNKITDKTTHEPEYYNFAECHNSFSTTHVSVLAEDGSAVAVTSSINGIFGSRFYSKSTGIILNNQLRDFCKRADKISPGERPPSSMAPAVLKSKDKTLVIGASGGNMITTGIASALINHLWFGKSLKEAIDAPVVYVDCKKNTMSFEPKWEKGLIRSLEAYGHEQRSENKFFNVVNAVEKKEGCIWAVSDERKLGEAAGY